VSVNYATANGTAVSNTGCGGSSLYVGVSGTLSFAPGATTKVVRVDLLDCKVAGSHTFTLKLSSPIHATIARASVTITISQ
jgi:hypothetical protein